MNINDIKFDHFKNIEELIKHLEMWYAEDDYDAYNRFFGLRDARIMGMIIYQLTNNWNELEKEIDWLLERQYASEKFAKENGFDTYLPAKINLEHLKNKMKEIKERNNE